MGRSLYNPFLNIGLKDDMHMLTIAGSRAGKGTTAIIPNLLLWEGSTIVIDPKGTNAAVTARHRREMGQNVYVIDPFGVVKDEECASFNPLEGLDPDSPMIREQLSSIAEALVVPDPNVKDTHWDDGARSILTGFLARLICEHKKPTLQMLRDLLALSEEETHGLYYDMSQNDRAGGAAKEAASRIIRGIGTNEILGLLSNADKHTEWLSSPVMHKAIEKASFNFSEVKDTPTTVYLVLPPEQLKKHNRFLRLFINMVISQMPVGGRAKTPVLMIMDEFLALGRMTEIEEAFAVMASYNLILWPFVQDLGRLNDLYGKSVNAFITNSRAVQVFGVTDSTTTEYISNNLGKKNLTSPKLVESSRQNVPHRTPDEVAKDISRRGGRQYILRAGEAPLLLEKVPYYNGSPMPFIGEIFDTPIIKGLFDGKYDPDPDFS